jgi:hypothetical protein
MAEAQATFSVHGKQSMRTVLSTPRRPSFRLGFTPAAQAQFNAASQAVTALYNTLAGSIGSLDEVRTPLAQKEAWFASLDSLIHEADAIVTASAAVDDAGLPALLTSLGDIANRMRTLAQQWAGRTVVGGGGERTAQRGWLLGALAVSLGLGAGILYITFSKRS